MIANIDRHVRAAKVAIAALGGLPWIRQYIIADIRAIFPDNATERRMAICGISENGYCVS